MQILSHYTNNAGLIGIGDSNTLRATEFLKLNDKSEITYGMKAIYEATLLKILPMIPSDLRNGVPDKEILCQLEEWIDSIRAYVKEGNGYDSFYITSFARGLDEEENKEGILTLWDRYTKTQGYCLQYRRDTVEAVISSEGMRHTYAILKVIDVQYGVDTQSENFKNIVSEFTTFLLYELAKTHGDPRFVEGHPQCPFFWKLVFEQYLFCATHKHPSFKDEREVRIIACPVDKSIFRPLDIRLKKPIETDEKGRRFIKFGWGRTPAFRPHRVIIGPNANLDEDAIGKIFPTTLHEFSPLIYKSTIPIAI